MDSIDNTAAAAKQMRKKPIKKQRVFLYAFLIFYLILSLFPVLWMGITSFKEHQEIYTVPPTWVPEKPTLRNYVESLRDRPFGVYVVNSLYVALSVVALSVVCGVLGGYGLARFSFRGSRAVFGAILSSRLVPPIALVVPFNLIMIKFGLIDRLESLIVTYAFFILPFIVWVMKGFFEAIPQDLYDAARVDGASKFKTFLFVLLPITRPGIFAGAILAFLSSWNEFLFALTLTRKNAMTVPIGIVRYFDEYIDWGLIAGSTVIAIIPAIVFILFFQRYIVSGITAGAVKS
ncbi:MAG: carbohydrate ABC transporter permease [Desulfobacterales bacterium]|nr:MAG: carbohydrate ABC transporter permease [Desulfobacterales bacterium]